MSKEQPFQYDEQLENARKHIEQHAIWRNEELEALKGVEFMNVKDIDIDALLYVLGFNTECV